jgi:hypothetical protein
MRINKSNGKRDGRGKMPLSRLAAVVVSVWFACALGCGERRDPALAGVWVGESQTILDPASPVDALVSSGSFRETAEPVGESAADAMAAALRVSHRLTLNANGTFAATATVLGQNFIASGTWTSSGDRITLKVLAPDAREAVGVLEAGAIRLSDQGATVTLRRDGDADR